jgi:deoxycytidylate deaminase
VHHSDSYYLNDARYAAQLSLDPSTRVGAVLVRLTGSIRACNRIPQRLARDLSSMSRNEKYGVVVHAEMAALATAARSGFITEGSVLYLASYDVSTGIYWGSAPCCNCTKHLLEAGIRKVVTVKSTFKNPRWELDTDEAERWLREARVEFKELRHDEIC